MRDRGIDANIDVSDCTSAVRLIAGSLNVQALQWVSIVDTQSTSSYFSNNVLYSQVCRHPSDSAKDNVLVVHERASTEELCNDLDPQAPDANVTPTPFTCDPQQGCIPTILG